MQILLLLLVVLALIIIKVVSICIVLLSSFSSIHTYRTAAAPKDASCEVKMNPLENAWVMQDIILLLCVTGANEATSKLETPYVISFLRRCAAVGSTKHLIPLPNQAQQKTLWLHICRTWYRLQTNPLCHVPIVYTTTRYMTIADKDSSL